MTTRNDQGVLREVHTLFAAGAIGGLTDGQLLERFATDRGQPAERAFSALVERHGPMVLRVCRSILADRHDSEDAVQATFLVLARKARKLWVRDSIGPWLHQVAFRTATAARTSTARRRRLERQAARSVEVPPEAEPIDDLARVLHEELVRLPERFRAPVVLCDLGGRTHEQAARHLGCPVGTVKSRLARARERLRARLVRRGLTPESCAGVFASALRPLDLDPSTIAAWLDATTLAAVRSTSAGSLVAGPAAMLAQEVLFAMSTARWLKLASIALVATATASGARLLAQKDGPGGTAAPALKAPNEPRKDLPVREVTRGALKSVIRERGSVEARENADVYNQVEGQSTIITIVPEGGRVTKGQLVCELDAANLKDQLTNQVIRVKGAEAAYQNARLTRETAEIAVTEYTEGVFKQELGTAQGEIALASEGMKKAKDRLDRVREARERLRTYLSNKPGLPGPAEILAGVDLDDRLDAASEALQRLTFARQQAQSKQQVLERFTRDRTVKTLQTDVERKRSEELAKQSVWELEKSKEQKLNRQIAHCKLLAPNDGLVVYANDPNRFAGTPQIEEGATVRERQKIFSIPNLKAFVVNAKVREAMVDQVRPGQKVQVRIDAFPDEPPLNGVVEAVAPLPDPTSFFGGDVKVYTTRIRLESFPSGLRPGMTASSEITLVDLPDAVSAPVGAVVRLDRKDHVAVKQADGTYAWRVVTLGARGDGVVEVKDGLKPGESVALEPLSLLTEAERQKVEAARRPVANRLRLPGKSAGIGSGSGPAAAALAKLRALSAEERVKLRSATKDEREALFKKAGLTNDESRLLEGMLSPTGGTSPKGAPRE